MNKLLIAENFDRSARTYDRYAFVQRTAAGRLAGQFPRGGVSSILEIGMGTGLLTEMLLKMFPGARIDALDISPGMVETARARFAGNPAFSCTTIDAEIFEPDKRYELIASNAVFHWFSGLDGAVAKYRSALAGGGMLAFTAFGPQTFQELRGALQACFGPETAIASSSFPGADAYRGVLKKYFPVFRVEEVLIREDFDSLLELVRAIKRTGTRGSGLPGGIPWGRGILKEVEKSYRRQHGGICASFNLLVCRACAE